MVALIGIAPTPRLFGATNPMLSIELNALGEGAFVPAAYRRDSLVAGAGAFRHADALRWPATGRLAHRFAGDYFDRIHLTPIAMSLGNVVSELTREVAVWNAWRTLPQTLTALRLDGDAGSTLVASAPLPLLLRPLQERVLSLTVGLDGPPVIDAVAVLTFADGATWSIRIDGLRTSRGPLKYTLARSDRQLILRIADGLTLPTGGLILPWPYQGTPGAATINGEPVEWTDNELRIMTLPAKVEIAVPAELRRAERRK